MHILLLAIILITTSFSQEIQSITIPSGVQIEMSGEVEMEFIEIPTDDDVDPIVKYAELLENNIKEQPELWLWSHKRWKLKKED